MKFIPIFLIIFWTIIIIFPQFLAYLIGGFFLFIGINILFLSYQFGKIKKNAKDAEDAKKPYMKFGDYEIYR